MGLDAQHLAQLEASLPYVQQKKNGAATTAPGNVNLAGTTSVDVAPSTPNGIRQAPDVYRAIAEVATGISRDGIAKGRRNEQQGYGFRGIDDVYNALSALLANADLCILPRMLSRSQEERITAKGGTLFYVVVMADFDFVSARDGSKHTVTMYGEAMDSGDKATNKAMSAAFKYCAMQTFCIPTEGMADADAETHTPISRPPAPSQPAPRPAPAPIQSAPKLAPVAAVPATTTRTWANIGEEKNAFWDLRHKLGTVRLTEEFERCGFKSMKHLFEQSGVKRAEFYDYLLGVIREEAVQ